MSKKIEQQQERLESIQEFLQQKIEERENTYENRSEKWQDSDKGYDYEQMTTELMNALDYIEEAIDSFDRALQY